MNAETDCGPQWKTWMQTAASAHLTVFAVATEKRSYDLSSMSSCLWEGPF